MFINFVYFIFYVFFWNIQSTILFWIASATAWCTYICICLHGEHTYVHKSMHAYIANIVYGFPRLLGLDRIRKLFFAWFSFITAQSLSCLVYLRQISSIDLLKSMFGHMYVVQCGSKKLFSNDLQTIHKIVHICLHLQWYIVLILIIWLPRTEGDPKTCIFTYICSKFIFFNSNKESRTK